MPEFYMIFARKMPKFYMIIVQKIFHKFLFLGWGRAPCPSPTPMLLRAPRPCSQARMAFTAAFIVNRTDLEMTWLS